MVVDVVIAVKADPLREALEKIIQADQRQVFVTIECDPAGNTMRVDKVDGQFAQIARAALASPSIEGQEAAREIDRIFHAVACEYRGYLPDAARGLGGSDALTRLASISDAVTAFEKVIHPLLFASIEEQAGGGVASREAIAKALWTSSGGTPERFVWWLGRDTLGIYSPAGALEAKRIRECWRDADAILALGASVTPHDRGADPAYLLPCDVHLPPATFITKGCKLSTLLAGLKARESYPAEAKHFPTPPVADRAGDGWQPIETAPKDGRFILAFWPDRIQETIAFDPNHGWMNGFDDRPCPQPTYWKPLDLPVTPKVEGGTACTWPNCKCTEWRGHNCTVSRADRGETS